MDYSSFGHFLSYIQMMVALDLALIFIDKGSLAVKLQNRILNFIRELPMTPILTMAFRICHLIYVRRSRIIFTAIFNT